MTSTNYIKASGNRVEVCLDVIFKADAGVVVSYAPALNLSGCGKTIEEAKQSFEIVLREYIKYTREHGTLEEDLLRHNWKKESLTKRELFVGQDFWLILVSDEKAQSMTRGNFSKSSEILSIAC